VAKLYAYWITINYREAYGMHASNGILFNHESPIRGETFVTRKITPRRSQHCPGPAKERLAGQPERHPRLGSRQGLRPAMWLILQQDVPDDYVIATGVGTTVREFVQKAFACIGLHVAFRGEGVNETGVLDSIDREVFEREVEASPNGLKPGQVLVSVDPFYFRPTEVDLLIGDATKARQKLGWAPTHTIDDIVRDMMKSDMRATKQATHLRQGGFKIFQCVEDIL
jgi:GDPmannose 4,6-dehydratase